MSLADFLIASGVIGWCITAWWLYQQSCSLARRLKWAFHPNKKVRRPPWQREGRYF